MRKRGLCYRQVLCTFVCVSVCLSLLVHSIQTHEDIVKVFVPSGSASS